MKSIGWPVEFHLLREPIYDAIYVNPPVANNGRLPLPVPEKWGSGLEFNEDALRVYTEPWTIKIAFQSEGAVRRNMEILEVLNPVAHQRGVINAKAVNQRPSTLEGAKVGLVWSGTAMGDVALRQVEEMLKQRCPSVEVNFYQGGLPAPAAVLEQVATETDVVIGATAD